MFLPNHIRDLVHFIPPSTTSASSPPKRLTRGRADIRRNLQRILFDGQQAPSESSWGGLAQAQEPAAATTGGPKRGGSKDLRVR